MKTEPEDSAFSRPSSAFDTAKLGLTKREYFAGLMMQAILFDANPSCMDESDVAESACKHADALIEALNKEAK